ncbi:MAG: hypothetical protein WCH04_18350 [Gammaproteobacteria bacterium]
MGFIHHIAGAAGATGLMAESARPKGSVRFEPPGLLADLPGLLNRAALIGDRVCHADRAATSGEPQPGQVAAEPSPEIRFRIVKGQVH